MKKKSNEILNFAFGLVTGAFIAGWLVFLIMDKQTKNQIESNTQNAQHHREDRQLVWQNNDTLVYRTISF
jgi:hypothetical protein